MGKVITTSEMREKAIMYITALHINHMLCLSTQRDIYDNIFWAKSEILLFVKHNINSEFILYTSYHNSFNAL